jgi:hypothetical protein
MGSELAVAYEQGLSVKLYMDPEQVLADAMKAAVALKKVIDGKDKPVIFNGEKYIEREDWGTVAKFYGCTAQTIETRYVEFGDVKGWEAVAVCLDSRQNIISRAESMCLNDEDNWGLVTAREWVDRLDDKGQKVWDPKGGRNKTGGYIRDQVETKKAKPMFQLRSMAQTRAEAKVLKSVFGYVVVLAGYKPSVAEEMTGNEQPRNDADPQDDTSTPEGKKTTVTSPQRASEVVELEISGTISEARLSNQGTLWFRLGEDKKLVALAEAKTTDDMVNGTLLTVKTKKMKTSGGDEFWGVTTVVKCEPVIEGDATEDESQDDGADASAENQAQAQPVEEPKTAVMQEMSTVFEGKNGGEGAKMKTAAEVADSTAKKQEKSWQAHVGHDPAKHISFKQGLLLFRITGKNGLNISDEVVKELLTDVYKADGHRYLVTKEDFPKLLDVLDPEFKFHERK